MKTHLPLISLLAAASLALPTIAAEEYAPTDTLLPETKEQKDARMEWWRDARFGMFIHWGLYAVPAGIYEGKPTKGLGEWIMRTEKIPVPVYEKYARQFNPTKYDAEKWVKIANDAGMKYIVITSKHHDGFCLWDSKVTDYDIVDATPYKKDLLKPLADACKKEGIKLCFYHSIMDWHQPFANRDEWGPKDNNPNKDWDKYRDNYMIPQLKELIGGKYGDIGVVWFDGDWIKDWTEPQGKGLYNLLRTIKPNLIVNNRVGKGRKGMAGMNKDGNFAGDFGTPEQQIPAKGIPGTDWETCMTMNDTWGYRSDDHKWKSSTKMIRQLVDTSSKGGNFLLNVGPTAEGEIPAASVERLKAIGDWMDVNSEAIYGSGPSPYDMPKWGRYTTKPGKLYAHIFDWPADNQIIIGDPRLKVGKVYLLADPGQKPLKAVHGDKGLTIKLPKKPVDEAATVVVIQTQ